MQAGNTDPPLVILDASVALTWALPEQATAATRQLFLDGHGGRAQLRAPALLLWEYGNGVLQFLKQGRIQRADVEQALSVLRYPSLRFDPLPATSVMLRSQRLAIEHQLSTYDASYLELAQRTSALLATLDGDLRRAAGALGIRCIFEN